MNYIIAGINDFSGGRDADVRMNLENTIHGFSYDFDIALCEFPENDIVFERFIQSSETIFCHFDFRNGLKYVEKIFPDCLIHR